MRWEPEAAEAMKRVPRFVRRLARGKIEELVSAEGRTTVTLADVKAAREKAGFGARARSSAVKIDETEIRELEKRVKELSNLPALQTRHYSIKQCGAAAGCPRARVEVEGLARAMRAVLDNSGLARHLEERIEGPILTHNKFRIALSGCANACSQPQIVDFGAIGRVRPGIVEGRCDGCEACVRICSEGAIRVAEGRPVIDREACIECGDCAQACQTEALQTGEAGYTVLAGGRLGRHPHLAGRLVDFCDARGVLQALGDCLDFYLKEAQGSEKFSILLERKKPEIDGSER